LGIYESLVVLTLVEGKVQKMGTRLGTVVSIFCIIGQEEEEEEKPETKKERKKEEHGFSGVVARITTQHHHYPMQPRLVALPMKSKGGCIPVLGTNDFLRVKFHQFFTKKLGIFILFF
jgi:hypothetical protein